MHEHASLERLIVAGLLFALPALVIWPDGYRAIAMALIPADDETSLPGWRMLGLFAVGIGVLLIEYGYSLIQWGDS